MSSTAQKGLQEWEHHIHSFVQLCSQSNRDKDFTNNNPGLGDSVDDSLVNPTDGSVNHHRKTLSGITVGVKDIINVEGVPTRNGSAACDYTEPATADAQVVAALRTAGAIIVGKTTTTEYAFTDPTNCRNPHDLNRSPGGSSSGSGAAVAAGLVDIALGTQTAGSLCRPAAYCGVVGFKPSHGVLSTKGVTPLAPSFDAVGIIARSVELALRGFLAMSGQECFDAENDFAVVSAHLPTETTASKETQDAFLDASDVLRNAGTQVKAVKIDADVAGIVSAHRIIMNAEAAALHKTLLKPETINLLRPNFRNALEMGSAISETQIDQARRLLTRATDMFWSQLAGVDFVLTLPVPEGAPLMDGTTGFQDWLTPWTVFGGPLICLPWGIDTMGRPRSVMLAALPGKDTQLLAMAAKLERLAPPMLQPKIPR